MAEKLTVTYKGTSVEGNDDDLNVDVVVKFRVRIPDYGRPTKSDLTTLASGIDDMLANCFESEVDEDGIVSNVLITVSQA